MSSPPAILPECKVKIDELEKDVKEIHDVVYKDGLCTKVHLISQKVNGIEKVLWAVGLGILGLLIESLVGIF